MRCRSRSAPPWALALGILLGPTAACSGDGGAASGAPTDAGADSAVATATDPLAHGRWERVFSGENGDWPNTDPRLDLDDAAAHLLYVAKANNLRYYRFPHGGEAESLPIPSTVKNPGRIVVTAKRTVILTRETFNGDTGTLFVTGRDVVSGPAPFGPAVTSSALTAARSGDDVLVAAAVSDPPNHIRVVRLVGDAWSTVGEFAAEGSVRRVTLEGDGTSALLHSLEGENVRHVRRFDSGTFRDLGAPPPTSATDLTSAAVDGARTYFVEYQADNRSTVWLHDGTTWSELVRSGPGESFHGLAIHRGGLYTFSSDLPNGSSLTTRAIARLTTGRVDRIPFDRQSADPNIDPDSRIDVMSFERSYLVSRGDALFMTYEELGTPTIIHLYRWSQR